MNEENIVPFDVYWPCASDGKGGIVPAQFIQTVHIPVVGEDEYAVLTEEAHRIIDTTKFKYIFRKIFKNDDEFLNWWWTTPNSALNGLSAEECIEHPKTQRILFNLAVRML